MALLLSVVSALLVGMVLTVTPWTAWWDTNPLIQPYPFLRAVILNPFLRGAASGLGLLNMLLAFQELYEYFKAPADHLED